MSASNYDFVPQSGVLTVHPKVVDVLVVEYGSKTMSIMNLKRDLPFSDITAIEVIFSDDVTVTGVLPLSSRAPSHRERCTASAISPTIRPMISATWTRPQSRSASTSTC